jgi:hypothetical protein
VIPIDARPPRESRNDDRRPRRDERDDGPDEGWNGPIPSFLEVRLG